MPRVVNSTATDPAVGARMRAIRLRNGLSLWEVGRRLGVSAGCISTWELGKAEPRVSALPLLADVLHCEVRDFFEDATPAEVVG